MSVRDWLMSNHKGARRGSEWTDLWSMASTVDFRLAGAANEQDLMSMLATEDMLEIALRRLASYVYEKRSGDTTGAAHMLAIRPPGLDTDLAPVWMVSEATQHSKTEHQRDERVAQARKRAGAQPDGSKGGGGPTPPRQLHVMSAALFSPPILSELGPASPADGFFKHRTHHCSRVTQSYTG